MTHAYEQTLGTYNVLINCHRECCASRRDSSPKNHCESCVTPHPQAEVGRAPPSCNLHLSKEVLSSFSASLGRVNEGSTAPRGQHCCSMQIGLFLFLPSIAITQSCACNKLP